MTEFVTRCEPIDVTSTNRPDTGWCYIDKAGHEHRWYDGDEPASTYSPTKNYHLPTLRWVVDGMAAYPDGEEYEEGHHECVYCGEHVLPSCTGDSFRQHIPGPVEYEIDGVPVLKDEFERRYAEDPKERIEAMSEQQRWREYVSSVVAELHEHLMEAGPGCLPAINVERHAGGLAYTLTVERDAGDET